MGDEIHRKVGVAPLEAAIVFRLDGHVELVLGDGEDLAVIPENIRWALAVMYALKDEDLSHLIDCHFDKECQRLKMVARLHTEGSDGEPLEDPSTMPPLQDPDAEAQGRTKEGEAKLRIGDESSPPAARPKSGRAGGGVGKTVLMAREPEGTKTSHKHDAPTDLTNLVDFSAFRK